MENHMATAKKTAAKKTAPKEKRPPGRVTTFTQKAADKICKDLSEGIPLAEICRGTGMPSVRTVSNWKREHPEFGSAFTRAREDGFDAIAEEALRIADTPVDGVEVEKDEKGKIIKTKHGDMLGHRRLQIETRLKLLAKWSPNRYGDKIAIGGADDLPPIKTMTDEDLDAKIAAAMASLNGAQGEPEE